MYIEDVICIQKLLYICKYDLLYTYIDVICI